MSIEKMSLVHIAGSLSSLDAALLVCCESGLFHIEQALTGFQGVDFHMMNEENPYTGRLQMVTDIMNLLEIPFVYQSQSASLPPESEWESYLSQTKASVSELYHQKARLESLITSEIQTKTQLEHLKGNQFQFGDVLKAGHYTARFGRLPIDSYLKLEYFSQHNFFFFDFDHDDDYYWGAYFAPNSDIAEIDQIFQSIYFEPIEIPESANGTPEHAISLVEQQLSDDQAALEQCQRQREQLRSKEQLKIQQIYSALKVEHDAFSYRSFVTVNHNQFFMEGFVPKRKVKKFIAQFDHMNEVLCEVRDATDDKRLTPPVQLKTNWFFKPFEMYVKMFGLPNYNEINPTSFIGLIYVLLFGVMFGDLGQGLVLAVGGFLLWKIKKMQLAAIISRCGISSMIFGFAYGSVFGYEHLLDPVFKIMGFAEKPIDVLRPETTNLLLVCAIGIGVVIIISSILINIYLGLKKKNLERALFSNNGIAGLILYAGVILAAVLLLVSGINVLNPIFIILVVILPMLVMMFREPLTHLVSKKKHYKFEEGLGGFIMQNFFELFEYLLSYITNTLSFLRVGGFVLSHAGLMTVVMTLAEMVGGAGSPVVVVIGNIIVMGMEGLMVGIQVLRLVFYETFSRFYGGDGKAFEPIKIDFSNTAKENKK